MEKALLIRTSKSVEVISIDFDIPEKPIFLIKYYKKENLRELVVFCNNIVGKHRGVLDKGWNFLYQEKLYFVVFSFDLKLIKSLIKN